MTTPFQRAFDQSRKGLLLDPASQPLIAQTFDAEGRRIYKPENKGFWGQWHINLASGGKQISDTSNWRFALRSGGEALAVNTLKTRTGVSVNDRNVLMHSGENSGQYVPIDTLAQNEWNNTIPIEDRAIFTARGIDFQLQDFESFDQFVDSVEDAKQILYLDDAKEHSGLGSHLAAFTTNVISDPFNLVIVGGGGLAAAGAKQLATRAGLRAAVRSAVGPTVAKPILRGSANIAANNNLFMVPIPKVVNKLGVATTLGLEAGSLSAGIDVMRQLNQDHLELLGYANQYDPTQTFVSGLAGLGLGWSMGKLFGRSIRSTNSFVAHAHAAPSGAMQAGNVARLSNKIHPNQPTNLRLEVNAANAWDGIEYLTRKLYGKQAHRLPYMQHGAAWFRQQSLGKWNLDNFLEFLQTAPTLAEVQAVFKPKKLHKSTAFQLSKAGQLVRRLEDEVIAIEQQFNNLPERVTIEQRVKSVGMQKRINELGRKLQTARNVQAKLQRKAVRNIPVQSRFSQLAHEVAGFRKELQILEQIPLNKRTAQVKQQIATRKGQVTRRIKKMRELADDTTLNADVVNRNQRFAELSRLMEHKTTPKEQGKLLDALMDDDMLPDEALLEVGVLRRLVSKAKLPDAIGLAGTGIRQLQESNDPYLLFIASLVDDSLMRASSLVPNKNHVWSFQGAYNAVLQRANRGLAGYRRLVRKGKKQRDALDKEVMLELANLAQSTDPDTRKASAAIRAFLDDIRDRGFRNRSFAGEGVDNYVPYRLNPKVAAQESQRLIGDLWNSWRTQLYEAGSDPELHINTLLELGFVTVKREGDGAGTLVGNKAMGLTGDAPTNLSHLPDDLQKQYIDNITSTDGVLYRDATDSFSRRIYQDSTEEADNLFVDNPIFSIYEDRARRRKIEQDVFLTSKNIDEGIIMNDIGTMINDYAQHTGYYVMRQDSVRQATNIDNVSWNGVLEWLKLRAAKESPEDQSGYLGMVDLMERAEKVINGRLPRSDTQEDSMGRTFANFATTLTQSILATVGVAASVETGMSLARAALGSGRTGIVRRTLEAMRPLHRKEYLESIGRGIEHWSSATRFAYASDGGHNRLPVTFGDKFRVLWEDFKAVRSGEGLPRKGATGSRTGDVSLSAMETGSGLVKLTSGEEFWTDSARYITATTSADAMLKDLSRMEQFLKLSQQVVNPTEKQLRGYAREAGFPGRNFQVLQRYIAAGLVDDRMLAAARRLRQLGGDDAVRDPSVMARVIARQKDDTTDLVEFMDRTLEYVRKEVDDVVLHRSAWHSLKSPGVRGPLGAIFNALTSYSRLFYSRASLRITNDSVVNATFLTSVYFALETLQDVIRDPLFRGKSIDATIKEWEENFDDKLATAVARVPWLGAWTGPIMSAIFRLGGLNVPGQIGQGGAGLSTVDRAYRGLSALTKEILDDDYEMSPGDSRAMWRTTPGLNAMPVQVIRRLFGPDEDRE